MTATRNTLITLGLLTLGFLAASSALGAGPFDCAGACEATCDTPCPATCASQPAASCNCWDLRSLSDEPFFAECQERCDDFNKICQGCTWKTDVSVLILQRSNPGTRTVLFDPATNADLFDASNLTFPAAAGPRVSVTALDCEGWGFEVNYFGVDGWSAVQNVPNMSMPSGSANLAVDSVEQLNLTTAHFESIARLYSTEVNFRKPLFGDISFLAGFRWVEATDRYSASGTSSTTLNTSSETILTHNHMYGFQLGADGILAKQANCWKITGFVKGGIFLNNADQGTSLSDPGGLGVQAANNTNNVAAFFGEAGLAGYVQLTKHLSATGGYQVIFINNVAQPVNQLAGMNLANSSAVVDTSAGLFYHGATVGLEVSW